MYKRLSILILLTVLWMLSYAQDPQISQFYSAQLLLGPSFAGSTDGSRAGLNFRDQWPVIPGSFITYAVSYDHYFAGAGSGVGAMFLRDQAGTGKLSTTDMILQYSYSFRINRRWNARPGIQFYYSERSVDYNRMTFGDQVSVDNVASTTVEVFPGRNRAGFIDFAASGLVYSDRYWAGLTADHLARPNESLLGIDSRIPMTYKVYGGGKVGLNGRIGKYNEESLTFAFLYKAQGKYDQLDVGVYWLKKPLIIGLWYRGIPFLKSYQKGYQNNDALVILVGCKWNDLSFGYSYDFTISRLITSTGGAHEGSLQYEFLQNLDSKKKRKKEVVPCPKFWEPS
ncbi:MAG: type IX secretion system membrane protein PorP/SprF [Bacteroidetes bacterium]|nr:type IX secretion system membrane protein PorP/SprF [Bacteroidota bacterium]